VAVRVGENLAACRLDGFDLQTWLAEDLVDVLILGSGTIDIEVEEFRALTAGSRVRVYPCLYGWPSRYSPVSAPLARGLAANYWHQGADGIYLFNWFPHEAKSHYQIELLRQVGDPVALEGRALMFAADRGFADRPDDYYPHNWLFAPLPAELWPTQTGAPMLVPVRIGPRICGVSRLRVEMADLGEREVLVSVAGQTLGSLRPAEDKAWTMDLPAGVLRQGLNHIGLSLRQPADAGPPPRIEAVEVHVPGTL
jgi:hypothetical protein